MRNQYRKLVALVAIVFSFILFFFQNCSKLSVQNQFDQTDLMRTGQQTLQSKIDNIRSGFGPKMDGLVSSSRANALSANDLTDSERAWAAAGLIKSNSIVGNQHINVGVSEQYGGTIFEIKDSQGRNKIDVHGGSAVQLSIWGYDTTSVLRSFLNFGSQNAPKMNPVKGLSPANETACGSEALIGIGPLAGLIPWNPIMAQDRNCSWDTYGANRVDDVTKNSLSISIRKDSPKYFNISSSLEGQFKSDLGATGLTWWQTVQVPSQETPYAKIIYRMKYDNDQAGIGLHNQEIPALFNRFKNGSTNYFYEGQQPYQNSRSVVSSAQSLEKGAVLILPGQSSYVSGEGERVIQATEAWQSVCRSGAGEDSRDCITIVTFSPLAKVISQTRMYSTVLGQFSLGNHFDETWSIYVFPYKYDEVINGKTVRDYIYDLAEEAGVRQPAPVLVNGGWSGWVNSGSCSKECGGGLQNQNRSCTSPAPANGGQQCVGNTSQQIACNSHACPIVQTPVNGGWSGWVNSGSCSKECGGGLQNQNRSCTSPAPANGGQQCVGNTSQQIACNSHACPIVQTPVNGGWSSWVNSGSCSKECGSGLQNQNRSCTNPAPAHGGQQCSGNTSQQIACNSHACPVVPPNVPAGYSEVQSVNAYVGNVAGQTGAWWCENHFGKNYGGKWECLGANANRTIQLSEKIDCGRVRFSDVRTVSSTVGNVVGQTGAWWCENHFGRNLGGSWECIGLSCSSDATLNQLIECGRR